jgi:hypothetical protein
MFFNVLKSVIVKFVILHLILSLSTDYMHDPYSEKDACNTICCRGDLTARASAGGCYDTKVMEGGR